MIVLERREPESIAVLEAILRRLPVTHVSYSYFEDKLAREKTGYAGELRVDREWLDFSIGVPYCLLNGFQARNEAGFSHQIDTLFICQYFVLVIESKNLSGRIDINEETNQCIRTRTDGLAEGFSNPVDQVKRHGRFIKQILTELDFHIPVECAVIFANPYSVIGRVKVGDVLVFQLSGLRYKLESLFQKHRNARITTEQMDLIAQGLIARQITRKWEPNIDSNFLRKGALCSNCKYQVPMQYKYGKWICIKCGNVDNTSLYQALRDYRLLWSERISNREFREFIGIESRKTAYRLLKDLKLESEGELKNKKYLIPEDFNEMSHKN